MPLKISWSQGEHEFDLRIGQIRAIQQALLKPDGSQTGIGAVCAAMTVKEFNIDYVYEVLRNGLIGGGLETVNAAQLAERACDSSPYEAVLCAIRVLEHWFSQEGALDLGKSEAGAENTTPQSQSTSQGSTEKEPPAA